MRIQRTFQFLTAIAAVTLFTAAATAADETWKDCIWVQAGDAPVNYLVSPGQFTKNGADIGDETWPEGGKIDVEPGDKREECYPPPGAPPHKLPGPPNDFHFGPDIINKQFAYWGQAFWNQDAPPPKVEIPLPAPPPGTPPGKSFFVQVDYNQDPPMAWVWENPPWGPDDPDAWDKETADIKVPLDFLLDGDLSGIREVIPPLPLIPTVSEWGLIILCLLLLTAGTIVIRRAMVQSQLAAA